MYDASAFAGRWPFTPLPAPSLARMLDAYRAAGVRGVALSPMGGVLEPEPMHANLGLLRALESAACGDVRVVAVPILNPSQAGWERDLDACLDQGAGIVGGIRVVPGYHAYSLEGRVADALAEACAARGLTVCVQARMEDERCHHPLMKVPPPEPRTIAAFSARHPRTSILVCGAYMAELPAYAECRNVVAEMSFVESGHLLRDAIAALGPDRLAIGTHAPLLAPESGFAKLHGDTVSPTAATSIGSGNFLRLFGRAS